MRQQGDRIQVGSRLWNWCESVNGRRMWLCQMNVVRVASARNQVLVGAMGRSRLLSLARLHGCCISQRFTSVHALQSLQSLCIGRRAGNCHLWRVDVGLAWCNVVGGTPNLGIRPLKVMRSPKSVSVPSCL